MNHKLYNKMNATIGFLARLKTNGNRLKKRGSRGFNTALYFLINFRCVESAKKLILGLTSIYCRWICPLLLINTALFSDSTQSIMPKISEVAVHKKNNLSICAIIKNETKYLKEWIEFHRLVGVDHFYLYSNDNSDHLRLALQSYVRKGIVTYIPWIEFSKQIDEESEHWALSTQFPAYENAIKFRALRKTKWLALLNTDEYLVPVHSYTITDLLQQYESYPAIILETDVFDGSQVNLSHSKQMLIESHNWIKSPPSNAYKTFTKPILQPELCTGFTWPPYQILFKENQKPLSLQRSEMRINRYANRDKPFLDSVKHKLFVNSRFMPKTALLELLDQGYAIEDDEQVISRYLPDLRKICLGNEP